jgi:hypothetical protein
MMAAMGLGGVGALALKALGVSMMALMLAGIVALKKLTEGGGDGGHSVHYVCIFVALIPLFSSKHLSAAGLTRKEMKKNGFLIN